MKLSYPEGIVVNILMDAATQICPFLRISSLLSFRGLECSLWFMLLDFGRVVCVLPTDVEPMRTLNFTCL